MTVFHHFLPITVRYSDIDAQGHVNNTRFGTYIESGRIAYLKDLELWDGKDFRNLGLIVADVHITYHQPITLGQSIQVATRVSHIGNKSVKFESKIVDEETGKSLATAETITVGFDYKNETTVVISEDWGKVINDLEGTQF